ncbi:ribonuclease D [Terricaulis silvestris]|uniref:Ribonuclease D n=1 Tax=Terricaulis silvestris TaxID=2686094 RepID=A0A6I6MRL0_9CAUL|nr:ribonuclease D [Terricaulis silvestris]QGZ95437.1 Ribonuclease D [Terricaulis silvestris]
MRVITKTADLETLRQELAAAPFVAVDTEFMRETTYWPKLCLIQAAAEGVEAVIDPLAEGLDLGPFMALMADRNVLKIFHAARQDLEIFLKLGGALPHPVFDSQIAAMACGYGDTVAYDALVQQVLKRRLDKSSRFTDWSRRPLSESQLAYALADVTHLRDLYPKLHTKLESEDRLSWLDEEHANLLNPAIYDTTPENAWNRLKLRKTTADFVLGLQVAAAWRERQAQLRDVPRGRIVKDEALYEIAEQRPKNAADFDRMRAVPRGFGNSRSAQELIQALDRAFSDPNRDQYKHERLPPLPSGLGPTVELLKVLLRFEAEHHQVAPRLIASASDVEAIAASDTADVAALRGWRRKVFGERALALKHGKLALKLKDGKVFVEDV